MNKRLLEILDEYKEQQKQIPYSELTELLKTDDSIVCFVNLSADTIRIYSSRFNCHIYNIVFEGLDNYDFVVIKKILRM